MTQNLLSLQIRMIGGAHQGTRSYLSKPHGLGFFFQRFKLIRTHEAGYGQVMGAGLHRRTGLPILVSGGSPRGRAVSEARLMDRSLREDFGLHARWLENKSDNTHENARFSAPILKRHGISKVILVTHASHMTRSLDAFKREGLSPIPGPIQTSSRGYDALDLHDFLPSSDALVASRSALHELLGRFWYRYNYDAE